MTPRAWRVSAGLAVALLAVRPSLSESPAAGWLVVVVWAPVLALAWNRHVGTADRAWRLLLPAIAVHAVSLTAWVLLGDIPPLVLALPTLLVWPLIVTAFRRLGGPVPAPHDVALDTMVVVLGLVTAWWSVVLGPRDVLDGAQPVTQATNVVSLLLTSLALGLVLQWAFHQARPLPHMRLLAGAALAGVTFPLLQLSRGGDPAIYETVAGGIILGTAYLCLALAALHPSTASTRTVHARSVPLWMRMAVIVFGLGVPISLRTACVLGAPVDCGPTLLWMDVGLVALVALRLGTTMAGLRRAAATISAQARLHQVLAEHAGEGVALFEGSGVVRWANPVVDELCGQAAVGRRGLGLVHEEDAAAVMGAFRTAAAQPGHPATVVARPRRQPERWLEMRLVDRRRDPEVGAFVANVRDVTAARQHEDAMRVLAYEDALTGVMNRPALLRGLTEVLADSPPVALLFCDLDRLKLVNDTLGHSAGDRLLILAAERMRAALRPGDLVGRIGGDEFLLVLPGADHTAALVVADRVRDALNRPMDLGAGETVVSCSIGIAVADDDTDADALVAEADAALYRAKQLGRDRTIVADDPLRSEQLRRHRTQVDLPRAIAGGQLRLVYQPIISLHGGAIWGVEALVRWAHPTAGTIMPGAFIDIAEETGLIVHLGREVMRLSVAAMAAHPEITTMSLNVAPQQLESTAFDEDLLVQLAHHDVHPGRVQLEITERTLLAGSETAIGCLSRLRSAGVRVALDDFGSGYASFGALGSLPLDVLKVDQSLVLGGRSDSVLGAVVTMAHALELAVIVEGVETVEQLRMAVGLGADHVQGFLVGRPTDALDLDHMRLDDDLVVEIPR